MGIFLLNPFILQLVQIQRTFFDDGYDNSAQSTTGTAFTAIETVNTTEPTAEDYAAFWQSRLYHSVTNSDARAELFETSTRQQVNIEPQATTDRMAVGGAYYYAGGTNKTFQIRYSAEAGTSTIGGESLVVLKLDAAETGNVDITVASTTSTTMQVRLTITFPESGDYYVIGSCELLTDNADADMNVNNTIVGVLGDSMGQDATTYSPYFNIYKHTATAGQTAQLRYRSNDGTTMSIRGASLLALKADKFPYNYDFSQPTEQTTTSTSYIKAANSTFTITNPLNYHLLLGCGMLGGSTTTGISYAKLTNETRTLDYMLEHVRQPNATTEYYPTIVSRIINFPSSDTTTELAWRIRTSAAAHTAGFKNIGAVLVDTGVLGPTPTLLGVTDAQNSGTITLPANLAENDIVVILSFADDATPATPTGFTAGQSGAPNTAGYNWSWKRMGATPDTSASGLTTATSAGHIAVAFRGIDTTTAIDVTPPTVTTGATTGMPDPPTISTASANTVVLAMGFLDDDLTADDTGAPTNYLLIRSLNIGAAAAGGTLMIAYRELTATATENPGAFTGSGSDSWVGATVALRKA